MADDPWAAYRLAAAPGVPPVNAPPPEVPTDPYSIYRSPGLTTPTPPPSELRASSADKYRGAAIADIDELTRKNIPLPTDLTSRIGMGASLGWMDELFAGGMTPIEMARHGTPNPFEGYRYAKAKMDLLGELTRKNTEGVGGALAEGAGGLLGAGGALGRVAGSSPMRIPFTQAQVPAAAVSYGKNIGLGAGLGAVAGAGEAPDIQGIPAGMVMGGILGAGVGAAAQPVLTTLGSAARVLQAPRLADPERLATARLAEVARRSGVAPEQLVREVSDAAAAGQPYTVADALGHEGQRALAGMAKTPGEQRQAIADALTARNLNRPERVGGEIGQALGAPGTAEASRDALIAQAAAQAAPIYRRAEQYPTWSNRLQQFLDDPAARAGLRQGVEIQRLEAVGRGERFNPRDLMITDFDAAGDPIITGVPNVRALHTMKVGLDRMIENEQNPITGSLTARGRALVQFRNGMLNEMDAINPAYAEARRVYGGPMRVAEAIRTGQQMATGGRAADTVPAFQALPETEQQGVRIGYADKLRGQLEGGDIPRLAREKSFKGRTELEALSQYQGPRQPGEPDPLRRYLNREETMQATSNKARGGSSTAENIADVAEGPGGLPAVLGAVGHAAHGNLFGAARSLFGLGTSALRGQSEAQRVAITRALLETNPDAVQAMAARIAEQQRIQAQNPFGYRRFGQ